VGGHAADDTSDSTTFQIELGILIGIVAVNDERLIDRRSPGLSIESWDKGVTGRDADGLERAFMRVISKWWLGNPIGYL
jgi:hypothetical protein